MTAPAAHPGPPQGAAWFVVDEVPGPGGFRLTGPEGHHAAAVRRVRAGETLVLVDGRGGWAAGEVAATDRHSVGLTIDRTGREAPPGVGVTLVQAVGKGDRGEDAVDLATQAGVDEVVPWFAERSQQRWAADRAERSLDRWRAAAREAAKQARRAFVPPVGPPLDRAGVLDRIAAADLALVLHESATVPVSTLPYPPAGEILLIVGPEGGVAPDELTAFTAAGAHAVRLGPHVLRSVSAAAVALGALGVLTDRWRLG